MYLYILFMQFYRLHVIQRVRVNLYYIHSISLCIYTFYLFNCTGYMCTANRGESEPRRICMCMGACGVGRSCRASSVLLM